MEKQKNTFNEELLDVIRIMIDKAMETTTRIYNAVSLGAVSSNKCMVILDRKKYRLNCVGTPPKNGSSCKVFVPDGNFSAAFVMSGGETELETETYTVGDGLILSGGTLSVNFNSLSDTDVEDMWDDNERTIQPSNIPNSSGNTIQGAFIVGYGLTLNNGVISVNLDELTASNIEDIWSNQIFQMASYLMNDITGTGGNVNFTVGTGLTLENGVLFVNLPEMTATQVYNWWQV